MSSTEQQAPPAPPDKARPYIFVFDLETTGLPEQHGRTAILEIAGIILDPATLEERACFHRIVQPPHDVVWSSYALQMHRKHKRGLRYWRMHGISLDIVMEELEEFLRKWRVPEPALTKKGNLLPAGHNSAGFDVPLLRKEAGRFGLDLPLDHHAAALDTCGIAYERLIINRRRDDLPRLDGVSLKNLAPALGIDFNEEEAHSALYDVRITAEVLRRLLAL